MLMQPNANQPTIHPLPEEIINRIAAGEVIERPASVVKELLENALDAGATQIDIHIGDDTNSSWQSLISIRDNGIGMDKANAKLALQRHATSKLTKLNDLTSISTLGFRGEALASIASISQLTMITKRLNDDIGVRLVSDGGNITDFSESSSLNGTTIEIRDLFYNTPVRKKFLKSDAYELRMLVQTFTMVALPFLSCGFQLKHGDKVLVNFQKNDDLKNRVACVFSRGAEIDTKMVAYVDETNAYKLSIHGIISHPHHQRKRSDKLITYVNHRLMTHKSINHAILSGYDHLMMRGQYPQAVLMIEIDQEQVDVNVHPTKKEVAFQDISTIYRVIRRAIKQTLENSSSAANSKEYTGIYYAPKVHAPKLPVLDFDSFNQNNMSTYFINEEDTDILGNENLNLPQENNKIQRNFFYSKRILGTVLGVYILLEDDEGLLILDQHAAHERITYDQLCEIASTQKESHIQPLLIPEVISITPEEEIVFQILQSAISALGIDAEIISDGQLVIRTLPEILLNGDISKMIVDILSMPANELNDIQKDKLYERLATRACRSSIKANDTQSDIEIRELLRLLDSTTHPTNCPHGRPTFVRMGHDELDKLFKRRI